MQIEEKYQELINEAKEIMSSIKDNEHNIAHTMDVVRYTKELLDKTNLKIDKDACIISAYWHDVGRKYKDEGHEKLSAEMLKMKMKELNYNETLINTCYKAIETHKWNMTPTTNEGIILKDADKLAFIGSKRWTSCLKNNQRLGSIIELLPKLRNEILILEESREIYDREIINLIKFLYETSFNRKC